jgi:hypothetical protein
LFNRSRCRFDPIRRIAHSSPGKVHTGRLLHSYSRPRNYVFALSSIMIRAHIIK